MRSVCSWLAAAADLVLPRRCAGCGRAATWWCPACAAVLDVPAHLVDLPVPLAPGEGASSVFRVAVVAPYRGPAGAALVAWKARGVLALGDPLARALATAVDAVTDAAARDAVLVPIPSRAGAVRARGGDVVAELARGAAAGGGGRVRVVPALTHARAVLDQAGLSPAEREDNLAGALRVRPRARPLLAGRPVVLVDDVLTTGASLREARRALRVGVPDVGRVTAAVIAGAGAFGPLSPPARTG